MKTKTFSTRTLCYVGIFTAIIAACAQIVIPQPGGVPFTLQAWAVALGGLVLGPKNGALAALVYVLLGAAGAPVFAAFTGGLGVIMRPTGGFILSFPIMALLAGLVAQKKLPWQWLGLAAGSLVNWTAGLLWFNGVTGLGLEVSFGYAVAPFILVGVVRTAVLPLISRSLKAALRKAQVPI